MAINVGRIDRAMPSGGGIPNSHDPAAEAAFKNALGEGVVHRPTPPPVLDAPPPPRELPLAPSGPLGAQWPAELPNVPNQPAALPSASRWVPPATIHTVREALVALAGIDRAERRRLLTRFGGTLDAGQLGYVLDTSAEVAAEVVLLLDEVGDGRLGEDELDQGSLEAALQRLDGVENT